MTNTLLAALTGFCLLTACEKGTISTDTSITYGTSFGMCVGYCVQNVKVDAATTTFTKSKHQNPETKTCTRPTDKSLITEALAFDEAAFNQLPERIGCPDCADGGAEFIEITRNGKTKRVTFEYGKVPTVLANAVAKLKPLMASFKDCN